MALDKDTVNKIASLAKLNIADIEIDQYQEDLSNILDLVAEMQECNTDNVEVMTHPMDATMLLRDDVVTESNNRDSLQAVAPATDSGLYLVPKVLD